MIDLSRVNSRWLTMPTATRCLHLVSRAEPCTRCDAINAAIEAVEAPPPFVVTALAVAPIEATPVGVVTMTVPVEQVEPEASPLQQAVSDAVEAVVEAPQHEP